MRFLALTFCLAASVVSSAEPQRKHWSYRPVLRPALPTVNKALPNPIDRFVVARLERAKLALNRPASPSQLLRRVYLDLIGLPPSPEELDEFLADERPDAYVRVVDRLLASPHYGEHWGRYWLDVARYADTNGYNIDVSRPIYPFRDWVINAINQNMPFDQFTIEQIAGDLLPKPTIPQRVATGFHRNTMVNQEGGVDPEEDRIKAVVDRVNTTAKVWLGSTLECANCHNHFYDPFTQEDFFGLFAFFNSTTDKAATSDLNPFVLLLTRPQRKALFKIRSDLKKVGKSDVKRIKLLKAKEVALLKAVTRSLAMRRRKMPRLTRVHIRGDFLDLGEKVSPGVPAVLHPLPRLQRPRERTRLDLAHWLVAKENPLVGRVTMNRHWQRFFGAGLVSTSGDFGRQGAKPTHPKLLDWLAAEFVQSGWNVKRMHRMIVTSQIYQQSSASSTSDTSQTNQLRRLLALGPSFRLDAESIRDVALWASGNLNRRIGGASVYPQQPAGFWLEFGTKGFGMERWPTSKGAARYRRGLYTFWRRTSAYPTFTILDAPSREHCIVQRARSNTPLQALTTLNDPAFVECAVGLATRVCRQTKLSVDERIRYAFRLCLSRFPRQPELTRLRLLVSQQHSNYLRDPAAARKLVGKFASSSTVTKSELAAWTIVASVLLNLDESLTKR